MACIRRSWLQAALIIGVGTASCTANPPSVRSAPIDGQSAANSAREAADLKGLPVVSVLVAPSSKAFIPISAETVDLIKPVIGFESAGFPIALAPSAANLASLTAEGIVQLWDLEKGVLLQALTSDHGEPQTIAFSPDSSLLAVSSGGTITLWRVSDGTEVTQLLGHEQPVTCTLFSPDGSQLASLSRDGFVRLWDLSDGRLVHVSQRAEWVGPFCSLAFSSDSQLLAGPAQSGVSIWRTRGPYSETAMRRPLPRVYAIAVSPDTTVVAAGSLIWGISLFRVVDGSLIDILQGHSQSVDLLAFSPDSTLLASAAVSWPVPDPTVRLWDWRTGTVVHVLEGHTGGVRDLAFSPDSSLLAVTTLTTLPGETLPGLLKLWNVSDGTLVREIHGFDRILGFAPDGHYLAVASTLGGKVELWGIWR